MKAVRLGLLTAFIMTACAHTMAIRGPAVIAPGLRKPDFLCLDHRPMVAIVIDDIGRRSDDMDGFLALPVPITFSVFPGLPFSTRAIAKAVRTNHEVWGHIPMEPIMASVMEPDLTFLLVNDPPAIIRKKLDHMLDSLPGIKGINNHMGSRFTQMPDLMGVVIRQLKARHLYFLDSRTTSLTKAEETAIRLGLPGLRRAVFLDDIRDPDAVETSMDKLAKKAVENGCALAIGHPFPETVDGIRRWLKKTESRRVRFVYVSDLISCSGMK